MIPRACGTKYCFRFHKGSHFHEDFYIAKYPNDSILYSAGKLTEFAVNNFEQSYQFFSKCNGHGKD